MSIAIAYLLISFAVGTVMYLVCKDSGKENENEN